MMHNTAQNIILSRFNTFIINNIPVIKNIETFTNILTYVWKNIFITEITTVNDRSFVNIKIKSVHMPSECKSIELIFAVLDPNQVSNKGRWYLNFFYQMNIENKVDVIQKNVLLQNFILGVIENYNTELIYRDFFLVSFNSYIQHKTINSLRHQLELEKRLIKTFKIRESDLEKRERNLNLRLDRVTEREIECTKLHYLRQKTPISKKVNRVLF